LSYAPIVLQFSRYFNLRKGLQSHLTHVLTPANL